MRWIWTAMLALTTACSAPLVEEAGTPPPREYAGGACRVGDATPFVGQAATAELGAQARAAAGARTVRWIRPGDAVTMDFREDRLNIMLDANSKVTSLRCG